MKRKNNNFKVGDRVVFSGRGKGIIKKIDPTDNQMHILLQMQTKKGKHIWWIPRNSLAYLHAISEKEAAVENDNRENENEFEDGFDSEVDEADEFEVA